VIDWFNHSDILFMPSLSEGLPVVGVQALAMGLGIVASKIGGFIDLVDNGINGYLIETSNPSGYQHALEDLITNAEQLKAFREASRVKARCFDVNHIVQSYDTIFHEVKQSL
jgi:glycosyltransferase involved in cell wall biosynthesis